MNENMWSEFVFIAKLLLFGAAMWAGLMWTTKAKHKETKR